MSIILITTLVLTALGMVVSAGLVFAGKKFHVETDERVTAIRSALPGNNCGACGFAGCDAMAAAIAAGDAPAGGCPVGGAPVAERIASIMGTEAESAERQVAFVRCGGTCDVTRAQGRYMGIRDCRSVVMNGLSIMACDYGCLGLGSCAAVCPQHAIRIREGVAQVDEGRCVGCGLCVSACPRDLIELVPADRGVRVRCSNRDRGPLARQVCSAGCIGCMLCTRQCAHDAISVSDHLARVDYTRCIQCGRCAEQCPVHAITVPGTSRG